MRNQVQTGHFDRGGCRTSVAVSVVILLSAVTWPPEARTADPSGRDVFSGTIQPFISSHCAICHGAKKQNGELNLMAYGNAAAVAKDRATWQSVLGRLRDQEMPPAHAKQPTNAERQAAINAISAILENDRPTTNTLGRVTARRLNRAEYNNTVRDLFGIDLRPADDFPADDIGYGFDNIGDVLSLSPLLMEKYLSAADQILDKVFAVEVVKERGQHWQGWDRKFESTVKTEIVPPEGPARILLSGGEISRSHLFDLAGEYSIRVKAFGRPAGDEPPRMALRIDDREFKTFDVKTAEPGRGAVYDARVQFTIGEHRLAVGFLNPLTDPKPDDPKQRERGVGIEFVEFRGPLVLPPPRRTDAFVRLMANLPAAGLSEIQCARRNLAPFVRRAYRRPATAAEIDALLKLVSLAAKHGDSFEHGMKLALKAVLVSPNFLFRLEKETKTAEPPPISDLELASRLSYFLWSSTPDDDLLRLAEANKLRLGDTLSHQVRRLLGDTKARALADNFAGQWLLTRNLKTAMPDRGLFPGFDDGLRDAMAQETSLFFDAIVHEDRSVFDLIDADFTFVNERLAKHYGIPGVKGPEFRKVSLAGTARAGVLTHGSVMTVTSNPTRTSPVKRGKFILENILGTEVPPPPPDAGELSEDKEKVLSGSLRRRMEQHRENPSCASCHQRMDPLGFAFENFDAVGSWRTKDGNFAIDSSGTLPDGRGIKDPADLRQVLRDRGDQFRRCLAEKMLTYAVGRGLEPYDRPAVEDIRRQLTAGQDRFSALVLAVVQSGPFQMRMPSQGTKK